MTTLVYVGPTLPVDEVKARLPDATVMPPAAVGDILRATRRRGVGRIAIIDGYFERMAAIWHKEILVALGKGIDVWGAASMGALRAAECDQFGMVGVGEIYKAYARGELVADDEVAVAHMPAEYAYRSVTDALVNIRFGLAAAVRERVITKRVAEQLLPFAQRRFYRDRTWGQLVEDGRAAGLAVDTLESWPKPDRKADDARLLLRKLRSDRPRRSRQKIRVPRTWALRQLEALL